MSTPKQIMDVTPKTMRSFIFSYPHPSVNHISPHKTSNICHMLGQKKWYIYIHIYISHAFSSCNLIKDDYRKELLKGKIHWMWKWIWTLCHTSIPWRRQSLILPRFILHRCLKHWLCHNNPLFHLIDGSHGLLVLFLQ